MSASDFPFPSSTAWPVNASSYLVFESSCSSSRDRCVLFPKSHVGLLRHFYIQTLPFSGISISLPDVTNNIGPK